MNGFRAGALPADPLLALNNALQHLCQHFRLFLGEVLTEVCLDSS